jgi:hypothetical protein
MLLDRNEINIHAIFSSELIRPAYNARGTAPHRAVLTRLVSIANFFFQKKKKKKGIANFKYKVKDKKYKAGTHTPKIVGGRNSNYVKI